MALRPHKWEDGKNQRTWIFSVRLNLLHLRRLRGVSLTSRVNKRTRSCQRWDVRCADVRRNAHLPSESIGGRSMREPDNESSSERLEICMNVIARLGRQSRARA